MILRLVLFMLLLVLAVLLWAPGASAGAASRPLLLHAHSSEQLRLPHR